MRYLLVICLVLTSCVPSAATVARQDGFDRQWRGFDSLPATPDLHAEADVKVRVIVEGNQARIGYPNAVGTYSTTEGNKKGTVRIVGKLVNGKIITCPVVAGHELQHALEYQGVEFADPDRFGEYGY